MMVKHGKLDKCNMYVDYRRQVSDVLKDNLSIISVKMKIQ